jgi:ribosomal protein S18 acetylase RimI-like enzyme
MNHPLTHRPAGVDDLDLLAEWNQQMIRDEGHRNRMSVAELRERMGGWLTTGEYQATLFHDGNEPVAYGLYQETADEVYLRQLFVRRERRHTGIGRAAMRLFLTEIWPRKRFTVEVLCGNQTALDFYRELGCRDYSIRLEIMPSHE